MNKNKNKRVIKKVMKRFDNSDKTATDPNAVFDKTQKLNLISSGITSGIQMVGLAYNSFSSPSIQSTPVYTLSSGPISYLSLLSINSDLEMKSLNASNMSNTVGLASTASKLGNSIVPGVGGIVGGAVGAVAGVVGGLFKKNSLKKKIAEKNLSISDTNTFNRASSYSNNLENLFSTKYGNTTDDQLYNYGKTPFDYGKDSNAYVGKGETIINGDTGNKTEVQGGRGVGIDDVLAKINPLDAILGNKHNPNTGNTFAEDVKPLTRMEKRTSRNLKRNNSSIALNTEEMVKRFTQPLTYLLLLLLKEILHKNYKNKYDNGKLSDYLGEGISTISLLAPTIYNFAKSLQGYQTVSPNLLYANNPYESYAIDKMFQRRYNVRPEVSELRDYERRTRYNNSLYGSDVGVSNLVSGNNYLNMLKLISQVYGKKLTADNQYSGETANMMAQLGANKALSLTLAMLSAYDINQRNKAASDNYLLAAIKGISDYASGLKKTANEYSADKMKMDYFNKIYDLYHKTQLNNTILPDNSDPLLLNLLKRYTIDPNNIYDIYGGNNSLGGYAG